MRVGSASSNNGYGNNYNRRPTVVLRDERVGVTDKSSGAQARVNQRFVRCRISMTLVLFDQSLP